MSRNLKRKESQGEHTGRQRKKIKLDEARTIPVQASGPSSNQQHLGGAIDVERFTEARAFEIDAMHKAMKSASASSTQRVWQTLPRHLRRRAASHDVRRVPLRLRDRARQEMNAVKVKPPARLMSKRGKDKRLSRTETFLKRQRDKSWLETHIWHAKRMKMENMWGYRLAFTPTEKAFRPSHRASVHGAILHDASYQSTIQVQGPEKILRTVLDGCCDLQGPGPGAKRYLVGSRTLDTHIYSPGEYPFGLIGPATIFWRSVAKNPDDKSEQPGKGKKPAVTSSDPDSLPRAVWIRTHPAISDQVFQAVKKSASLVLDAARQQAPEGTKIHEIGVEIEDLSGQINAFEIMGPKANQVLKGALSPIANDSRDDFRKFWALLTDLQTSGSIPRGMIIGFKALDPRLKFPPKNAKPSGTPAPTFIQPTAPLAQGEIWDESIRDSLKKPRYKKKDIDERRSKNLVPGTPLSPLRQDDRVPMLLIQRSVERGGGSSTDLALHGWTLLFPAGWSMPFLSSLIFTGTRVGGQRERQTQAFEAGVGYFPRDYPLCDTYDAYAGAREAEERARWERTPPAKRANYARLGTRSPWRPDWSVVLGIEAPADAPVVSTQREAGQEIVAQSWLLRGQTVGALAERLLRMSPIARPGALANELNELRHKRLLPPLIQTPVALMQGALVRVRLTPCHRGRPGDLALIYAVGDEEARMWRRAQFDAESAAGNTSLEHIIGYVTTGNFSLSHGEGLAIGAVAFSSLLRLGEQSQRLGSKELVVKIRDRDEPHCRAAFLEVLDK